MSKKIISLLLIALMVLSVIPTAYATESAQIYLYSQFDGEKEGLVSSLTGWETVQPDGNEIRIEKNPESEGKCLKIVPIYGTPGGPFIQKDNDNSMPESFVIEGNFRTDDHSDCKITLAMRINNTNTALFTINESRQMIDVNGEVILSPFPDGKFTKIALAVDKDKLSYQSIWGCTAFSNVQGYEGKRKLQYILSVYGYYVL